MYTIGQVSELTGLPVSTLRYYDKQGLFPHIQRSGGKRQFGEEELETLRVIECLKRSGLEIKDIRRFMDWTVQGSETYPLRRAMLEEQRATVEAEMKRMGRALDMLKYKCRYYDQAIQDGNEERLKAMAPADMPEDIRRAYESAHAQEQEPVFTGSKTGAPEE
ncbi:MAG: MerR family transcriptional regulator [Oscillospiraceae bacterium]|nr:MerR family transcriptional regulator [Oscillospiraceae bacterium]